MVQGYGYNGERRDQSGLIYLRARYYNPKIGRFIQIDSYRGEKEQPDTQNRYIYTLNNPYKYTDPSGNVSALEILKKAVDIIKRCIEIYNNIPSKNLLKQTITSALDYKKKIDMLKNGYLGLSLMKSFYDIYGQSKSELWTCPKIYETPNYERDHI